MLPVHELRVDHRTFRSSWTERSRSERCRSTRAASTSTPCPARSGSVGRRGQARSSSPTRTRLRVGRPELPLAARVRAGWQPSSRRTARRGSTRTSRRTRSSRGCRAAIARDPCRGRTNGQPRWPSASASRLAESGRRCRRSGGASHARLLARSGGGVRDDRRAAGGRGSDRARSARAWADPCVRRLVDERRRSRASRGIVVAPDVLRPRLRATDTAPLRRGGVARRPRPRSAATGIASRRSSRRPRSPRAQAS